MKKKKVNKEVWVLAWGGCFCLFAFFMFGFLFVCFWLFVIAVVLDWFFLLQPRTLCSKFSATAHFGCWQTGSMLSFFFLLVNTDKVQSFFSVTGKKHEKFCQYWNEGVLQCSTLEKLWSQTSHYVPDLQCDLRLVDPTFVLQYSLSEY